MCTDTGMRAPMEGSDLIVEQLLHYSTLQKPKCLHVMAVQ